MKWERGGVETVVKKWAALLIPEWTVEFEWDAVVAAGWGEADPSEANAISCVSHHYNLITMWFNEGRECSAVELNVTVVHECLHAVMRDLRYLSEQMVPELATEYRAQHLTQSYYDKTEENVIDRLSRLIVNMNGVMRFG